VSDKSSAKAESLASVRELRAAAARAALEAVAHPTRAALTLARDASREAERAGSSHYVRHGGGLRFHDQNDDLRRATMDYDRRIAAVDSAERAVNEARARTPEFRAAQLAYRAEQAEDRGRDYGSSPRPGMTYARVRELRDGSFGDAARLLDEAAAIDPAGGYADRAALVRESARVRAPHLSHVPGALDAYQALARKVAANSLDRLADSPADKVAGEAADRALLDVSSAYGHSGPEADRARDQRRQVLLPVALPEGTARTWAGGWREPAGLPA
jgi:hypothetical protein